MSCLLKWQARWGTREGDSWPPLVNTWHESCMKTRTPIFHQDPKPWFFLFRCWLLIWSSPLCGFFLSDFTLFSLLLVKTIHSNFFSFSSVKILRHISTFSAAKMRSDYTITWKRYTFEIQPCICSVEAFANSTFIYPKNAPCLVLWNDYLDGTVYIQL